MSKKKIYISGKITGLPFSATNKRFERFEILLNKKGFTAVNPMKLHKNLYKSWTDFMIDDIKELMYCDAIFMMRNWGLSKGARIEYAIAKELGLEIIFEK